MPDDPSMLRVELKNLHPVDLDDLSVGMKSLGEEYRSWVVTHQDEALASDVRLFINEIRSGSIITDLFSMAPAGLMFIENTTSIIGFCRYLKESYDWLLGEREKAPEALDAGTLQNLSNIIEPVAKDSGSQMNIGTLNVHAPITINLNSMQANAVQNRVKREIEKLKEVTATPYEKVLLYWYQARNDAKSKAGDLAKIESICKTPVKAICVNESVKARMLLDANNNPFTKAFIVDVSVETIQGKPALYRILNIIDSVDISPEDAPLLPTE